MQDTNRGCGQDESFGLVVQKNGKWLEVSVSPQIETNVSVCVYANTAM